MSQKVSDQTPYPFSYRDWEELAKQRLGPGPFGYIQSGSGNQVTLRHNEQAFENWTLIPRVLADVSVRDTTTELFNQQLESPFLLAPVGFQAIVHPEGERASARSARLNRVPYIASTVSSASIEEIAMIMEDVPCYFQLYWPNDDQLAASFIQRAEQAGYAGIVVTVDTPFLGWREVDLTHQYFPMQSGAGIANFLTDPVFQDKYNPEGLLNEAELIKAIQAILFKQNLTWNHIAWLREQTDLPIILKGITHVEDAKKAVNEQVDGLIVSNHGGRQLDGVITGLDALPAIAEVVGNQLTLLVDGGIRRATDILKAFALGADAVLLGRPYVYGLIEGEAGVTAVLERLKKDLDVGLAIAGVQSIQQLNRQYIKRIDH
ncbi:alpha-hydroxy-acid oxidizing protein [Amphibacillus sediminis]|uniref:alpha-hydroxy-acid oxidizing protein n=1 Tax=Amphibacillus sediminis TaxID=360185 RepID=UPI000829E3BB|nr:alpha-hydroxy-acid oxidizing protein [Amphibacillus sediminis]